MNQCEIRHDPKYEVTYKPAKGSHYKPVWMVCEACMENRKCFGDDSQIESMKVLA